MFANQIVLIGISILKQVKGAASTLILRGEPSRCSERQTVTSKLAGLLETQWTVLIPVVSLCVCKYYSRQ